MIGCNYFIGDDVMFIVYWMFWVVVYFGFFEYYIEYVVELFEFVLVELLWV